MSPADRVKEFPGECLEVKNGKLFCFACCEELSLKKSTVKSHLFAGNKHKASKNSLARKEARERDIASYLTQYHKEEHPAGTSVSMEEHVYRVRVVESFLGAGVPLAKVDGLRSLLEENGLRLTHSAHLGQYIPPLLQQEKEKLRSELDGAFVSAIFDGTTRNGEALAVVVRFIKNWNIEQRLVRLSLLAKSVNGDELAREILTILSTQLGVSSGKLLACMRDGASVNEKAMNTLSIMYPHVMNIVCFSHSLDLVGTKFVTPKLDKFMKHWFGIFQHSSRAKLLWQELTGRSLKSFSATRWWSKWECQQQIMTQWGDVPKFLAATDVAPKSCQKLKNLLQTAGTELLIEFAVIVDVGEPFVKATYSLEGDGPLAPACYETLSSVKASVQVKHWPNTKAIARRLAEEFQNPGLEQKLMDYALSCVQPGFTYFQIKFWNQLSPLVNAFKAARLFDPNKVTDLHPDASMVEDLKNFHFLEDAIPDLKNELPTYLAFADGVAEVSLVDWWMRHEQKLPCWAEACQKVFTVKTEAC